MNEMLCLTINDFKQKIVLMCQGLLIGGICFLLVACGSESDEGQASDVNVVVSGKESSDTSDTTQSNGEPDSEPSDVDNSAFTLSLDTQVSEPFAPSKDGNNLAYTLYSSDGLPIANQIVTLVLEGNAEFDEKSAFSNRDNVDFKNYHYDKSKQTISVKTDSNGRFDVSVFSVTPGQVVLHAYVDFVELFNQSFEIDNNLRDNTISELSIIGAVSPVYQGLTGVTKIALIGVLDEFGNRFTDVNIDSVSASIADSNATDAQHIEVNISNSTSSDGVLVLGAKIENNGQPQDNEVIVSYDPTPLNTNNSDVLEVRVPITFQGIPASASQFTHYIDASNSGTNSEAQGAIEFVTDDTGIVTGAVVYNPTNHQVSEVSFVPTLEQDEESAIALLPESIEVDEGSAQVTQYEVVTKNQDGITLSTAKTSTISFEENGVVKTSAITETSYRSDAYDFAPASDVPDRLTLLDSLSGSVKETTITLPDGSVSSTAVQFNAMADGSVVTANKTIKFDLPNEQSSSSIGGKLSGDVEEITVVKTDANGEVIQQQTVVRGQNPQGEAVVAESDYQADSKLEINGEVVAGAVAQSKVVYLDENNNKIEEQLNTVKPDDGEVVIAPIVTHLSVANGVSTTINTPFSSVASDAVVSSMASNFEREYGIDFDGWGISKRVVPSIVADVHHYDSVLKKILNDGGETLLRTMLTNYPITSHIREVTAISPAGKNVTLLHRPIELDSRGMTFNKQELIEGRLEKIIFGRAYERVSIMTLEDGRTYLNGYNAQVNIASTLPEKDRAQDSAGNWYIKNVETEMLLDVKDHDTYNTSLYFVLLAYPGEKKRLVCIRGSGARGSAAMPAQAYDTCEYVNHHYQDLNWIRAFPDISGTSGSKAEHAFALTMSREEKGVESDTVVSGSFTAIAEEGSLLCQKGVCTFLEDVISAQKAPVNPYVDLQGADFRLYDAGSHLYVYGDSDEDGVDGVQLYKRTASGNTVLTQSDGEYVTRADGQNWDYRIDYKAYSPWQPVREDRQYDGIRVVTPDDQIYYLVKTGQNPPIADIDLTEFCSSKWFVEQPDFYVVTNELDAEPYIAQWNNRYQTSYSSADIDWNTCLRYQGLNVSQLTEDQYDKRLVMKDGSFMFFNSDGVNGYSAVDGLEHLVGKKGVMKHVFPFIETVFFEGDNGVDSWYWYTNRTVPYESTSYDGSATQFYVPDSNDPRNLSDNDSAVRDYLNSSVGFRDIYKVTDSLGEGG
ncbi:hypothetical protein [Vibrio sonorensis]|uniref:hypothetical protein n=1 Tax=Vibrio sonorensis TaxID=1004316 RepID=UPI0008D92231|nr:hypothetical protein [Vibrio sonorensis]